MQLPLERGPISRHVIDSLARPHDEAGSIAIAGTEVLEDQDAQLALWILYELHYRGFDGVTDDLEWHLGLLRLRQTLERRVEQELRDAVGPALSAVSGSD